MEVEIFSTATEAFGFFLIHPLISCRRKQPDPAVKFRNRVLELRRDGAEIVDLGKRQFRNGHVAMTIWLAGGGVNAGHTIGATDELGMTAVEGVAHVRDFHVTLLGLVDNKLTFYHAGRFTQLSQLGGKVIEGLIGKIYSSMQYSFVQLLRNNCLPTATGDASKSSLRELVATISVASSSRTIAVVPWRPRK